VRNNPARRQGNDRQAGEGKKISQDEQKRALGRDGKRFRTRRRRKIEDLSGCKRERNTRAQVILSPTPPSTSSYILNFFLEAQHLHYMHHHQIKGLQNGHSVSGAVLADWCSRESRTQDGAKASGLAGKWRPRGGRLGAGCWGWLAVESEVLGLVVFGRRGQGVVIGGTVGGDLALQK